MLVAMLAAVMAVMAAVAAAIEGGLQLSDFDIIMISSFQQG
jgi:hypothetical protein